MTFAIRFDLPSGDSVFAGEHKGGCGFAHTVRTAMLFDDPDAALRMMKNGYGFIADWGKVVPVHA